MDQELIAFLEARFRETSQQIAKLREETIGRFEQVDSRFEKLEETTRYTLILVEGLHHEVHLVAESVLGMDEKIKRYHAEATLTFDRFEEWIKPYYKDLHSRLHDQEDRVQGLGSRVHGLDERLHILEGRADRQQGDVMDAIRNLLGKPPLPPPVTSD